MKKFKKIYIEITNKCNLQCAFCSIDNKRKKEMSLEEFEQILIKINGYTDYIYLHVKGEPLIHSQFKDILLLCKKHNKKVNITTNGTLLNQRINDILETDIVRQINISMQSLTSDNYLLQILNSANEILNKTDIQLVFRFWALTNNAFTELQTKLIDSIMDYFKLNKSIKEDILNRRNIKLLNNLYLNKENLFEWPCLENNHYNDKGTCYGLKTHIAILVDGTVVPCCLDSKGIISLGNIFEIELEEILNESRTKMIIKGFNDNKVYEELCKHCSFKREKNKL
ncbi:MAG: radical SAM protein [Firmicutes bacterium]|nr:radical SAM protein [Bacillota bacterium]